MNTHECTTGLLMRRRFFLMLFFGAVLLVLLSGAAEAQVLNVKEHQITVSSAHETTPTLGNDVGSVKVLQLVGRRDLDVVATGPLAA